MRNDNDIPRRLRRNPITDDERGKCRVVQTYGVPASLRFAVTSPDGAVVAAFNSKKDADAYAEYLDKIVAEDVRRRRDAAPDGYVQLTFPFFIR